MCHVQTDINGFFCSRMIILYTAVAVLVLLGVYA